MTSRGHKPSSRRTQSIFARINQHIISWELFIIPFWPSSSCWFGFWCELSASFVFSESWRTHHRFTSTILPIHNSYRQPGILFLYCILGRVLSLVFQFWKLVFNDICSDMQFIIFFPLWILSVKSWLNYNTLVHSTILSFVCVRILFHSFIFPNKLLKIC